MIKHKNAAHLHKYLHTHTQTHAQADARTHAHSQWALINVNSLKHAGNYSFYDDRTMANGAYAQRSRELPKMALIRTLERSNDCQCELSAVCCLLPVVRCLFWIAPATTTTTAIAATTA